MPMVASVPIDPGRVVRATNTWAFDPHVSHINMGFKISNKEAGIEGEWREERVCM